MKYSHPAALMALAFGGGLCSITPAMAAPTASLALDQSAVYGGLSAKGTITLSASAPAGGVSVTLVSSNPALVRVPATVSVPSGKKTVTFDVTTQPVSAYTSVSITATYSGRSQSARIALAMPAVRWLKFTPYTVAGGGRTTGTIYLSSPAPAGGTRVQVSSGNPSLAAAPDSVLVPAGSLTADFSVTTTTNTTRNAVVLSVGPGRSGSPVTGAITILASRIPVPDAPNALTAVGQWDASCAPCDGMQMPEIALSWQAVPGATSYTVVRDGTPLQAGVTGTDCDDMTVESGTTYSYTVKAVNAAGESAPSAPASATAPVVPAATPTTDLLAPSNLTVRPFWDAASSKGTNALSWMPVSGAVSYNVYRYDTQVGTGIAGTSFTLPAAQFASGLTYSVTAVDGSGHESIPSAIAQALDAFDPNNLPNWVTNWTPSTPNTLTVTAEDNAGQTRNKLEWRSDSLSTAYNIYRDGALLARNITGQVYVDTVNSGENHTYTVAGVNTLWPTAVEGSRSVGVRSTPDIAATRQASLRRSAKSARAFPRVASHAHRKFSQRLSKVAPVGGIATLQIVRVVPNDDSAVIVLPELPAGAADYRVYDVSNPNKVKYAGVRTTQTNVGQPSREPYAIEWNGIDPARGANLVVEAVDKLGPFQKMDGMPQSSMANMDSMTKFAVNGQGDPSNIPNVIAQSAQFHVDCTSRGLTGSQAFFDNFRGSQPFAPLPMPAAAPASAYSSFYAHPNDYQELANDKWIIKNFGGDLSMSKFFFMGNHFMDTIYDGGGPNSPSPVHNNNASMVMMPKAVVDINGGKTLHVTFEVDAHFNTRRWCDVFVAQEGDLLVEPGKFADFGHLATLSGNLFRWEVRSESHLAQLFGKNPDGSLATTDLIQAADFSDEQTVTRVLWDHLTPLAEGTTQDLDKRHRFDLYLSQNRYRFEERDAQGNILVRREKAFPAGASLPFSRCQVYFVHQVYHTANDRPEMMNYGPWEKYWINHRPWADERHWDNMGQEVLDTFPQ